RRIHAPVPAPPPVMRIASIAVRRRRTISCGGAVIRTAGPATWSITSCRSPAAVPTRPATCSGRRRGRRRQRTGWSGGVARDRGGGDYLMHRAFVAVLLSVLTSGACTHRGGAAAPGATPSGILAVAQRVEHLDVAGREPMVVEHSDGSLFVAGYGLQPRPTLWKSRDRGATWTRVDVGSEAQGAIGNSDVDLAVSRDGTLYFVNMFFDRVALEGRQIAV